MIGKERQQPEMGFERSCILVDMENNVRRRGISECGAWSQGSSRRHGSGAHRRLALSAAAQSTRVMHIVQYADLSERPHGRFALLCGLVADPGRLIRSTKAWYAERWASYQELKHLPARFALVGTGSLSLGRDLSEPPSYVFDTNEQGYHGPSDFI